MIAWLEFMQMVWRLMQMTQEQVDADIDAGAESAGLP